MSSNSQYDCGCDDNLNNGITGGVPTRGAQIDREDRVCIESSDCSVRKAIKRRVWQGGKWVNVYYEDDGVTVIAGAVYETACPPKVWECQVPQPNASIDWTIEGTDCNGNALSHASPHARYSTLPPGFVQPVRICGTDSLDYEHFLRCAPDGTQVVTVMSYKDPLAPVASFFDATTAAPWTGDPATLTICPDKDLESDPIEMCDGATQFLRWIVKLDGQPTGVKFDTDMDGMPFTPAGPVTMGKCVAPVVTQQHKIFHEKTGGTMSIADIVAATGAVSLLSVMFLQVSGTGSVMADSGGGAPLYTGQSWAWNVVSSPISPETLMGSALSVDAQGGEVHVTAQYTV